MGLVSNNPSFDARITYGLSVIRQCGHLTPYTAQMINYIMYKKEVNRKGSNDPPGRASSGGILDEVGA